MVIHVSFDPADMGLTRSNLNGNPARLRADRYRNVREVAPTHDWQHRIQVVFDALGPTPPALCTTVATVWQASAGSRRELRLMQDSRPIAMARASANEKTRRTRVVVFWGILLVLLLLVLEA